MKRYKSLISKSNKKIKKQEGTITITFSEAVENHIGMEQIGKIANIGFTLKELQLIPDSEIISLHDEKVCGIRTKLTPAYILIIRNFVTNQMDIFNNLKKISWDCKYYDQRRQKVLNKRARKNICISDYNQEPDYKNGKGTVISWNQLPLLENIRNTISTFGKSFKYLNAEGNYYEDITKNGIGYHGDSERKKVVGIRFGQGSMPLYYQWYNKYKKVGNRIKIDLNPGDLYIMSDKAVGTDWKRKNIFTIRHATGAKKYTKI
jgi:hypothetical protein